MEGYTPGQVVFAKLFVEEVIDKTIDEVPRALSAGHPGFQQLARSIVASGVDEDDLMAFAAHLVLMSAHGFLELSRMERG